LLIALLLCVGCGAEKPPPATELEALIVIGDAAECCAIGLFIIAVAVCTQWKK